MLFASILRYYFITINTASIHSDLFPIQFFVFFHSDDSDEFVCSVIKRSKFVGMEFLSVCV